VRSTIIQIGKCTVSKFLRFRRRERHSTLPGCSTWGSITHTIVYGIWLSWIVAPITSGAACNFVRHSLLLTITTLSRPGNSSPRLNSRPIDGFNPKT
jgi:hypothetical protein